MPTILQLLKSKTVLFAILLAVLSVAQGYVGLLPLTPVQQMWVGIAISIVVTVLRFVTIKPLDEK
jgi:quinol-cytochrome oxidoreductase complex cytochrome b subunit